MFQKAKECIQNASIFKNAPEDFVQKCDSLYEYIEGLDDLTNKPIQTPEALIGHFKKVCHLGRRDDIWLKSKIMIKRFFEYLGDKNYHDRHYEAAIACYREALQYSPQLSLYRKVNSIQMKDVLEEYFHLTDKIYKEYHYKESRDLEKYKLEIALKVFYQNEGHLKSSCREPWLIFFRRTVLHGKRPSYKLAILIRLWRLSKKLNTAGDDEISLFLKRELKMTDVVRNIAQELNLPIAKRYESQEICFIDDRNYFRFIKNYSSSAGKPGPIADMTGKVIGTHKGIHGYTIGQRKWLGISSPEPLYVVKIDAERNTVHVGPFEAAKKKEFFVEDLNWFNPFIPLIPSLAGGYKEGGSKKGGDGLLGQLADEMGLTFRASVKVRSMMKDERATIKISGKAIQVVFDEPQWSPAPGQSAVFYDGDAIIGRGVII